MTSNTQTPVRMTIGERLAATGVVLQVLAVVAFALTIITISLPAAVITYAVLMTVGLLLMAIGGTLDYQGALGRRVVIMLWTATIANSAGAVTVIIFV